MSLHNIIEGCLQNKHREQKELYARWYAYSLKIVFRYIYRYDKAVDVVNDGFVKVFAKLNTFHYETTQNVEIMFLGWLRTIMIHTAIDRLRKDNFLPEIGLINEECWIVDRSQSADQALLYKELIREIKKLPPTYRVVFNMYVIDGYTHQEIANRLGIEVGTSKSDLSKAKGLLRKFIIKNDQQIIICNT
ncbi:MAG: RNA polymerase sigma factor [Ginsengibacter sp.]